MRICTSGQTSLCVVQPYSSAHPRKQHNKSRPYLCPCPYPRQVDRLVALRYVRDKYPFFNASVANGNATHIFPPLSNDLGISCCAFRLSPFRTRLPNTQPSGTFQLVCLYCRAFRALLSSRLDKAAKRIDGGPAFLALTRDNPLICLIFHIFSGFQSNRSPPAPGAVARNARNAFAPHQRDVGGCASRADAPHHLHAHARARATSILIVSVFRYSVSLLPCACAAHLRVRLALYVLFPAGRCLCGPLLAYSNKSPIPAPLTTLSHHPLRSFPAPTVAFATIPPPGSTWAPSAARAQRGGPPKRA